MGFTKKTWKNRIAEYINRRLLTMEDGSTNLVTVARDEGTISQEGDAFNAANMNDLEDRIEAGFADVSQSLNELKNINIKSTTDILATIEGLSPGKTKEVEVKDLNQYDYILFSGDTVKDMFRFGNTFLPIGVFSVAKESLVICCPPQYTRFANVTFKTNKSISFYANANNNMQVNIRVYGIKNHLKNPI